MMTCIHGVSVWTYCNTCEANAAKVLGADFYHQPKNPSIIEKLKALRIDGPPYNRVECKEHTMDHDAEFSRICAWYKDRIEEIIAEN